MCKQKQHEKKKIIMFDECESLKYHWSIHMQLNRKYRIRQYSINCGKCCEKKNERISFLASDGEPSPFVQMKAKQCERMKQHNEATKYDNQIDE